MNITDDELAQLKSLAFQGGYWRAVLDEAERAVEFYSTPTAKAKPVAAWSLIPCGYPVDHSLKQLAAMSAQAEAEDVEADCADFYSKNLDFLRRRLASLKVQHHNWRRTDDQPSH